MGNKEKVLIACDMIKKIQNEMVGWMIFIKIVNF